MSSTAELQQQLIEYESQLADIEEMLALDPSDESVLKLKSDLEELISLTKSGVTAAGAETTEVSEEQVVNENVLSNTNSPISNNSSSLALENSIEFVLSKQSTASTVDSVEGNANEEISSTSQSQKGTSNNKDKAKKTKVASEFTAPSHLIPLASDTDAEKNKKRRTLKALKSKWRERVKEISSEKKQKSWNDFNKKKRKKSSTKDESIFRTTEGVSARVGVIGSGKAMTGYGDRKRFKL